MTPNRIHLIGHASPIGPDIKRFGFANLGDYLAFIREHLPKPLRLTCANRLLDVKEDAWHGGRHDDDARAKDIQAALDDPKTLAIVAANGGAYFSRILPHLDFSLLRSRANPLWALGFSEMSTLVGLVASHRAGRGLYWLCPNWIAWRVRPAETAQTAFGEFWRLLPEILTEEMPSDAEHLGFEPIKGQLVAGQIKSRRIRLMGGCLAVLAAVAGSPIGRRLRPDGKWLMLEDIKESPYRIDRHLAALKLAGWFDKAAGILIGDFHMMHQDTQPAVRSLLKYHLPSDKRLPIVLSRSFGHVWPMSPVPLNRPLRISTKRREVTIHPEGHN